MQRHYVFVNKARCNEFIGRLNLRDYQIVYPNSLKKTTLLIVNDIHDIQDFLTEDYVSTNFTPPSVKILDNGYICIT